MSLGRAFCSPFDRGTSLSYPPVAGRATPNDAVAGPPPASADEDFFAEPPGDPSSLRRLATALSQLARALESADAAPTRQAQEVFEDLSRRIDAQLARWRDVLATDVTAAAALIREANLPAIAPPAQPPAVSAPLRSQATNRARR